ncbi:dephospho-CoA kinase [Arcticibacter sp. MXS-1]|uniref:dephospho-CoA kinase n=1 Tax=Arcticibacter sp. MXS-1 TaxID=3341726 RepID=UPI0035A83341
MLKLGITGGIGSGKTTVCQFFEILGVPVYYSDQRAKDLMHSDEVLMAQIRQAFGRDIYSEDGILNRKALAAVVFADPGKLAALNGMVHPAVFRDFDRWAAARKEVPYVLKEAAILFESGSYRDCDYTILVKAPRELRIRRVVGRDGITEEEVVRRMDAQMSDEDKEARADFVVLNDEAQLLIPQVLLLHERLLQESRKR